jgi:hypothetical protein
MEYHINGKKHESTMLVCRKCGERVWKSQSNKYRYECFGCGRHLQERGVMPASEQKPIVEKETDDNGFIDFLRADEYCPICENVTENVPVRRMSLCAHCGAELFPCAGCMQEAGCQWNNTEYGCQRFIHTPEWADKQRAKQGS